MNIGINLGNLYDKKRIRINSQELTPMHIDIKSINIAQFEIEFKTNIPLPVFNDFKSAAVI